MAASRIRMIGQNELITKSYFSICVIYEEFNLPDQNLSDYSTSPGWTAHPRTGQSQHFDVLRPHTAASGTAAAYCLRTKSVPDG